LGYHHHDFFDHFFYGLEINSEEVPGRKVQEDEHKEAII